MNPSFRLVLTVAQVVERRVFQLEKQWSILFLSMCRSVGQCNEPWVALYVWMLDQKWLGIDKNTSLMCEIGRMRLKVKNCYVSPSQFTQWNHSKEVQCFYIQYTVDIYLFCSINVGQTVTDWSVSITRWITVQFYKDGKLWSLIQIALKMP